jgi:hypothetical protein
MLRNIMSSRDAVYFESDAMCAFVPSGQSDWMLTLTLTPKKVLMSQRMTKLNC